MAILSKGMTSPAIINRFPNYSEMPGRVPASVWSVLRITTLAVTCALIVLLIVTPDLGLLLVWGLTIPLMPGILAFAPGLWRQVCPMAFLNQLPRMFGFGRDLPLPMRTKHLAYYLAMILFFVIVSLRHVGLNDEPLTLAGLIIAMLLAALVGGVVFKGRSGWCGTFCPLAPIQRAYGQAPIVIVKNGYCPTCVGCQKNCYDFNPRAAVHSDLADPDRWYAGHKEIFMGALPGFIIAFFLAENPANTGLLHYYLHFASWMGISLGLYMALTRLIFGLRYKVALAYSMSALLIYYWFAVPIILETLAKLSGAPFPSWSGSAAWAAISLLGVSVLIVGLLTERDFKRVSFTSADVKQTINLNAKVLGAAAAVDAKDLVIDRGTDRSFPADPGQSLLEGIETLGVAMDFGCRMGMCGADPIVVVQGADCLTKPTDDELVTLHRLGLEGRARMACVCRPLRGGVVIDTKTKASDLPAPVAAQPQADAALATGIGKVVIIGNGTAGMTAAAEIRRLSPSCRIDVVTKEREHLYNRMAIGRLLYGRSAMAGMHLLAPDWQDKNNVTVWLNTIAIKIELNKREVHLGTGEVLSYDRLILAQGSSAFVPPIDGITLPGCFVLRDAADAMAIRAWRQQRNCRTAVVLGGGVLGVEAADALRHLHLDVTIIERSPRLMERQLDDKGSAILSRYLAGLGVSVKFSAAVARIHGEGHLSSVELAGGERIGADILVACAGIKPNIEIAKLAGLKVNRGVIVDAGMQTSDPNVFAIGDVAELSGAISGLWAVSTNQARVAVGKIFGTEISASRPSMLVSLKVEGIDVKAFGLVRPTHSGQEVIQSAEEPAGEHRMLIVEGSKIVGAVFVGPPGAGKFIGTIIQLNMDIESVMADLRRGNWEALGRLVTGEAVANTKERLAQSCEPRSAVGPVVSDRSPTESLGPGSPRTAPA